MPHHATCTTDWPSSIQASTTTTIHAPCNISVHVHTTHARRSVQHEHCRTIAAHSAQTQTRTATDSKHTPAHGNPERPRSCLAVTRTCVRNCVVSSIEAPPPASAQGGLAAVHLRRHRRIRSSSRRAERTTCNQATTITISSNGCRRMTWSVHTQALSHGTGRSRWPNCTIIGVARRRGPARTVRCLCSSARHQLLSVATTRVIQPVRPLRTNQRRRTASDTLREAVNPRAATGRHR